MTLGSVSGFLPTIITSFGYTNARAQLFTVPPYAVAFVGVICICYISDRLRSRGIFVVILMLLSAMGFAILLAVPHNHRARYFATFPAVLGCFCNGPLMLSWASNTSGSHSAAAVRLGFMNAMGQTFSSTSHPVTVQIARLIASSPCVVLFPSDGETEVLQRIRSEPRHQRCS